MASPQVLETFARELRRAVNLMRSLSEALLAPFGVTVAMRALMEALAVEGPRPVPEIARARGVTRQHIQVIVNALADAGLAEMRPNPAHRRSSLIVLTAEGERRLAEIRAAEAPHWRRLARRCADADIAAALAAVRALALALEDELPASPSDDGETNAPP